MEAEARDPAFLWHLRHTQDKMTPVGQKYVALRGWPELISGDRATLGLIGLFEAFSRVRFGGYHETSIRSVRFGWCRLVDSSSRRRPAHPQRGAAASPVRRTLHLDRLLYRRLRGRILGLCGLERPVLFRRNCYARRIRYRWLSRI